MSHFSRNKTGYRLGAAILVMILITAGIFYYTRYYTRPKPAPEEKPFEYVFPEKKEIIPQPVSVKTLADSTRVYLQKDARITPSTNFSRKREVEVDGEMFFEVPEGKGPFIVRTRLLELKATGSAAFRVIAYRKEDGEEVQVLHGNIRARKAYPSQFPEPDTLRDNQLLMINISIDLMEKEKMDTKTLRAWRDSIRIR